MNIIKPGNAVKINLLWGLLITGVILSSSVFAQPELDSSFNGSGKTTFQIMGLGNTRAMAVQPDNKIVVVGTCSDINNTYYTFCYTRINETGTRESFGTGLILVPGAATNGTAAGGVAIQSDGKVVMSGYASLSGEGRVVVARLNADGSPDSSFGTSGIVTTDVNAGENDIGHRVAIQSDGKIVVAGFSATQQFVARYDTNGDLDSSFGKGGIARTTVPGSSTRGRSIAIQPDGKIVVGGLLITSSIPSISYLLTRFNPDGSPDDTWDGDGIKSIPYGTSPMTDEPGVRSVAAAPDGRIIALGYANRVVYSFNPDGSTDTGFGIGGTANVWGSANNAPYDLTVSAGGRITVVGNTTSTSPSGSQYVQTITKFKKDGSLDTSFSGDGYLTVGSNEGGRVVALDSQGRTIVAGLASTSVVYFEFAKFSVIRLIAPAAGPNVTISGRVVHPDGTPVGGAILLLQDSTGNSFSALTNPFGFYIFSNIPSGKAYAVSTGSKKVFFNDRSIFVDDEIQNFNIVADPASRITKSK